MLFDMIWVKSVIDIEKTRSLNNEYKLETTSLNCIALSTILEYAMHTKSWLNLVSFTYVILISCMQVLKNLLENVFLRSKYSVKILETHQKAVYYGPAFTP